MFKTFQGIPFSILELALVNENGDIKTALENSLNLAQHAEKWGYHRFGWRSTTICRGWQVPPLPY